MDNDNNNNNNNNTNNNKNTQKYQCITDLKHPALNQKYVI